VGGLRTRPRRRGRARGRAKRAWLLGLLWIAACIHPVRARAWQAAADTASPRSPSDGVPTLRAVRRQGPIQIDGHLNEAAWRKAPVARHFVQGLPTEGARPAEPTEVRVLYDDAAIYVGAHMTERDTSQIVSRLVRRDQRGQFDWFEVALDPNHDRQTAYVFRVNAAGVQFDEYLFNDSHNDENWDAVWSSAVSRDSTGWSVEMRIPLSQIRYESRKGNQVWGVDFGRNRVASNSRSYFALLSRTSQGKVSQFGRLTGIQLTSSGTRLQVEPYVATQLHRAPADPADPLFDGSTLTPRAGLNASYGLGSAFSLDATVNPDFGQVEVDPAVINLSAFETYFPEKRPFFVQDARVFDFQLSGRRSSLFFSRRIGRHPRGSGPDSADYTDTPAQTTILGAAKLTGRTSSGLSVGVLGAATQKEMGTAYFSSTDRRTKFVAQPRAEYGVVRLQQDFRDGASHIGGIVTAMHRNLPADSSLDWLTSSAFSGGLDFQHDWGGPRSRDWSLHGYVASTLVRGAPQALVDVQENSQHYFQRPDASYLSVDSSATSMTGANWRIYLERQNADHWTWSTWLGDVTPGFAANDMGFTHDSEHWDIGGRVDYQDIDPGPIFRSWDIGLFTFHDFRKSLFEGPLSMGRLRRAYKDASVSLDGHFDLQNNWGVYLSLDYKPQTRSDTQTRGGPLMVNPSHFHVGFGMGTDSRKMVSLHPNLDYSVNALGDGHSFHAGLEVSIRPSSNVELQIGPSWQVQTTGSQYVTTDDSASFAPTFGRRYFFGDLTQHQLSMRTRLNVAFSPTLSLQLFAQPLLASGDYTSYKQLARPESFDFLHFTRGTARSTAGGVICSGGAMCTSGGVVYVDYNGDGAPDFSFDQQDFNVRSLRGNAVLRWEFRPGSILYFVWQQSRRADESFGNFSFSRDFSGLLNAPPSNTFIVKASYFLNL
jgi:hypothetical protein